MKISNTNKKDEGEDNMREINKTKINKNRNRRRKVKRKGRNNY